MNRQEEMMNDAALDRLLAQASAVPDSAAMEQRLRARLASMGTAGNVLTFPQRQRPAAAPLVRWPAMAALAASLLVGVIVGRASEIVPLLSSDTEIAAIESGLNASDEWPAAILGEDT